MRLIVMLHSLVSAIAEMLVAMVGDAILKFFGLQQAAELIAALVGLACIAIGVAIWWLDG